MKTNIIIAITAITIALSATAPTFACDPAPSCWMKESRSYLLDICKGYAKDKRTAKEIADLVDEPEKVPAFIAACKKLGVNIGGRK